jgi:hypothetical protein
MLPRFALRLLGRVSRHTLHPDVGLSVCVPRMWPFHAVTLEFTALPTSFHHFVCSVNACVERGAMRHTLLLSTHINFVTPCL